MARDLPGRSGLRLALQVVGQSGVERTPAGRQQARIRRVPDEGVRESPGLVVIAPDQGSLREMVERSRRQRVAEQLFEQRSFGT